jgi:hypothetical protein
METDIFLKFPGATPEETAYFAAIGRALAYATRFESNCRKMIGVLGLAQSSRPLFESEQALSEFVRRIRSSTLSRNIHKLAKPADGDEEIRETLNAAREGRNFIAHHATLGFEADLRDRAAMARRLRELETHVNGIAEADRFVCLLISLFTRTPLPSGEMVNSYPRYIREWVFGGSADDG